jgi:cell fate regulator YaaT (PSP1 superfamily)
MISTNPEYIVGVRFAEVGKVYHFDPGNITDLQIGDAVIVETARGWQLGFVAVMLAPQDADGKDGWKSIERRATPRDLMVRKLWQVKEDEVLAFCRQRIGELRQPGVKVVSAEYSFDGQRLTILYNTESEKKVDLRTLRKDLQKRYSSSTVELRQIGPRDVAKEFCGLGACGLETRCCCAFLTEFQSISIRMAKDQSISLTPSEITGMCGRLRCCLEYEQEQYRESLKGLPKKNKHIKTPAGDGKVIEVRALQGEVVVDIKDVGKRVFTREQLREAR